MTNTRVHTRKHTHYCFTWHSSTICPMYYLVYHVMNRRELGRHKAHAALLQCTSLTWFTQYTNAFHIREVMNCVIVSWQSQMWFSTHVVRQVMCNQHTRGPFPNLTPWCLFTIDPCAMFVPRDRGPFCVKKVFAPVNMSIRFDKISYCNGGVVLLMWPTWPESRVYVPTMWSGDG